MAVTRKSELALDALGNPVRRDILRLLAGRPLSVESISARFPISRPAISRHLAMLMEAGFVAYRTEGTQHLYTLTTRGFDDTRAWLGAFWDDAAARLKLLAENLPERDSND